MMCISHTGRGAVGACVACGRGLCEACVGLDSERVLTCGDGCRKAAARRTTLERDLARSLIVSNWLPANLPVFGYALVVVIVGMTLLVIPDIQPGKTAEYLRWAGGIWGLAAVFLAGALSLRPLARAARESLKELEAIAATEDPSKPSERNGAA